VMVRHGRGRLHDKEFPGKDKNTSSKEAVISAFILMG